MQIQQHWSRFHVYRARGGKRRLAKLHYRLVDLQQIAGEIVVDVIVRADGVANVESVHARFVYAHLPGGGELSVFVGDVGMTGQNAIGVNQCRRLKKLLEVSDSYALQIKASVDRSCHRIALGQWPAFSLQANLLAAMSGEMQGSVYRERRVRSKVGQGDIDVIVNGSGLPVLLVGDGHLTVGDCQLTEGKLLFAFGRAGLWACRAGGGLRLRSWPRRLRLTGLGRGSLRICSQSREVPHALRILDQFHARPLQVQR